MRQIITLTTDFGTADGYVGTVKGVILSINPNVVLIDITHEVSPQDILEGAFALGLAYLYFPSDTIHVVVVDPGVGSARSAIAVRTPGGTFVGPDNGVLSWPVLDSIKDNAMKHTKSGRVRLPGDAAVSAVKLTQRRFWLKEPGRTFHARDVFGPVAAHLSLGVSLASLGEELSDLCVLPKPIPEWRAPNHVDGEVLKVDRFGNLITNLTMSELQKLGSDVVFQVSGREVRGLSEYYCQRPGLLALVGSSGYVEIALQNGSAAQALGVGRGEKVSALRALRGVPYA